MNKLTAIALLLLVAPVRAQEAADPELVGELMAFQGAKAIVSVMTTHCYETTGLDAAYKTASENWYLRNVGFLDLAMRVAARVGGVSEEEVAKAETYGGSQIMSAYNKAENKDSFCKGFLEQVNSGALDIDKSLPDTLAKAQKIAAQ